MDPQAALNQIRVLVSAIRERIDGSETDDIDTMDPDDLTTIVEDANELVDLFDGLDQWMARGGFLPSDWAAGRGDR